MRTSTIEALDRINLRFYSRGAGSFDQTRSGPWQGWQQLLERLDLARDQSREQERRVLRVLDVGCGNGRFASFLAEKLPADIGLHYVGHDASKELLASAHERLGELGSKPGCTFSLHQTNLLGDDYSGCPVLTEEAGKFDLVVSFGVLHHVPAELQPGLIQRCVDATADGGAVCISFWQFGTEPRFARRRLPWSWAVDHELLGADHLLSLDGDDWLLRWGVEGQGLARYCRYTDADAVGRLIEGLESNQSDRELETEMFSADGAGGRLNLYALLKVSS